MAHESQPGAERVAKEPARPPSEQRAEADGALPADSTEADRRQQARTEFCTKVWVYEFNADGEPDAGVLVESSDISVAGMGLRSRRMMYVGRSILIVLDLPGIAPRVMCAVVRTSQYCSGGRYQIGVEFCEMPSMARLRLWLQRRTAAG